MRKKTRGSKRRAVTTERTDIMDSRNLTDNYADEIKNESAERTQVLKSGLCEKGICGEEAACLQYKNNTYTCICPHNRAPPTTDGKCPIRNTESAERTQVLKSGLCEKGICGEEAACLQYKNNTYTCICPHNRAPPTADGKCPIRNTESAERTQVLKSGSCEKGICGEEATCLQYKNDTYACICPHTKAPPSTDWKCPVRNTESAERIQVLKSGLCEKGICGQEAACLQYENNTYTCICPHDKAPPTTDWKCPIRNTVPLSPSRIENIRPPVDNVTSVTTPALSITTNTFKNQNLIITGSVIVFVVTAMLIILIWVKRRYCSGGQKNSTTPSPIVLKRSLLVAERYAPNPQYSTCPSTAVPILKRETLKFLNEIGEGCFGKVFKGELQTDNADQPEIVAIKVLKETASREAEEDFLREVDIMSAFRHSNILSLLGVVLRDGTVSPMMVFEYMSHGDLAEVLRSQKKRHSTEENVPVLTSKDLLLIALQIANGMRYLAAQRFVHRDLACRNCLVSAGPTVKIADFGMSRDVYTCDYYKIGGSRLLPVRWMSPESVIYGRFTLESDIWSYGVILWEIYSFGKQPYYGHTNEEVVKLILEGIMLIPPEDCPSLICDLMQLCWKTEPRDRIRFADIYNKLEKVYQNHQEPDKSIDEVDSTKIMFENESKVISSLKRLPRPPPLPVVPQIDLLDAQGYLLPKEIKEPAKYLETLPD